MGSWARSARLVKPRLLSGAAKVISQVGCGDGVVKKRLTAHRFVAQDAKRDAVAPRVEAPVLEGQRRKHPAATARTGDAYHFALQVRRTLEFWTPHDFAYKLINYGCNKYKNSSLRGRAKH